jgi:hypothetical protein
VLTRNCTFCPACSNWHQRRNDGESDSGAEHAGADDDGRARRFDARRHDRRSRLRVRRRQGLRCVREGSTTSSECWQSRIFERNKQRNFFIGKQRRRLQMVSVAWQEGNCNSENQQHTQSAPTGHVRRNVRTHVQACMAFGDSCGGSGGRSSLRTPSTSVVVHKRN